MAGNFDCLQRKFFIVCFLLEQTSMLAFLSLKKLFTLRRGPSNSSWSQSKNVKGDYRVMSKGRQLWLLRSIMHYGSPALASYLPNQLCVPCLMKKGCFFIADAEFLGCPRKIQTQQQTPPKDILSKAMEFPFFVCLLEISLASLSALRASGMCLTALKFWDGALRVWKFGRNLQASWSVNLEEDPFRSLCYVCRVAHLVTHANVITVSASGIAHREE